VKTNQRCKNPDETEKYPSKKLSRLINSSHHIIPPIFALWQCRTQAWTSWTKKEDDANGLLIAQCL